MQKEINTIGFVLMLMMLLQGCVSVGGVVKASVITTIIVIVLIVILILFIINKFKGKSN